MANIILPIQCRRKGCSNWASPGLFIETTETDVLHEHRSWVVRPMWILQLNGVSSPMNNIDKELSQKNSIVDQHAFYSCSMLLSTYSWFNPQKFGLFFLFFFVFKNWSFFIKETFLLLFYTTRYIFFLINQLPQFFQQRDGEMQWLPLYPPSHQAGPTPSVPTPRGDNHPPVSLSPFFSSWILPIAMYTSHNKAGLFSFFALQVIIKQVYLNLKISNFTSEAKSLFKLLPEAKSMFFLINLIETQLV